MVMQRTHLSTEVISFFTPMDQAVKNTHSKRNTIKQSWLMALLRHTVSSTDLKINQ